MVVGSQEGRPEGQPRVAALETGLWPRRPIHPWLLTLYPILFLLAENVGKVDPLSSLRSILVSLVAVSLVYAFVRALWKDAHVAAALTSLIVLLFFTYGHVYQALHSAEGGWGALGHHRILGPLWAVAFLGGAFAVIRTRRSAARWTGTLNLAALAAVILALGQMAWNAGDRARRSEAIQRAVASPSIPSQLRATTPEGTTPPDIYYVILDMYTRDDVLRQQLGYDNSAFTDRLRALGFYVASCSVSNYASNQPSTAPSLASSLNMDYLDRLVPLADLAGQDYSVLSPLLSHNRVRQELTRLGYRIVNAETGYSPTEWTDADVFASRRNAPGGRFEAGLGVNAFESLLLQSSGGILAYTVKALWPASLRPFLDAPYIDHRDRILFELDQLEAAVAEPGPKFVFIHILAPHEPFAFGPDGEQLVRDTPFTLNADLEYSSWPTYVQGYTGAVTYLDQRIGDAVEHILAASPHPPVIIVQGDHGIPRIFDPALRLPILNALYLPGVDPSQLYPTMTPVNTFRLVWRTYFGAQAGHLPDISYVALDDRNRFAFKVLETADGCPATP